MKHAYIYLTEGIAKKSETQAFRRYTVFKQNQGETDIESIKKDFIEFRNNLRTDIISLRYKDSDNSIDGGKYEEGCTRLFLNDELNEADKIRILNNIISVILKDTNLYNQYDKNLNDLSLEELKGQFQETLEQISADEREEVKKMNYGNQSSSYDIVPIDSFNEAKDFYKLCIHEKFSNNVNPSEWCLTYEERHFNTYSSNGVNQIYFCIKNGISEDDEPIQGDGHPQDEYGNSMISVIVDEKGELAYSTSRWNHELKGSDQAYSVVDISRIVGVDFYKTFLPNHKFQDAVDKTLNMYRTTRSLKCFDYTNGTNIDDLYIVEISKKFNIINIQTGELLSDKWFDGIDKFHNGFARVFKNNKGYNFINSNGEFIGDKWFLEAIAFKNGLSMIKTKEGYNFINSNGEFICDNFFEKTLAFSEGFAPVKINNKWNFINTNGKYINDKWYDEVLYGFENKMAGIKLNGKGWNFINPNNEFISDIWFERIDTLWGEQRAYVKDKGWFNIDNYGNLYNKNGKLVHNGLLSQQNENDIANESIRRNGNLFINEVLGLNKRIKKLYE